MASKGPKPRQPAKPRAKTATAKPAPAPAVERPADPVKSAMPLLAIEAPAETPLVENLPLAAQGEPPAPPAPAAEEVPATPVIFTPAAPSATPLAKETIMEATIDNAAANDKAQAAFSDVNDRARTAMEKSARAFEDMTEFSKGNVEALVESGKIAARGIETLGQEAADYGRRQFEGVSTAMKSFSSAKSPTEFFKLQSDFIRQSFDSVVAETSKNTEAMLKLVGEAAQPISNRVAVAAEKVRIAA